MFHRRSMIALMAFAIAAPAVAFAAGERGHTDQAVFVFEKPR